MPFHHGFLQWLAEQTVIRLPESEGFTLASGRQSAYYVNLKSVLMHHEFLEHIGWFLWTMVSNRGYEFVSGMETAAIPLVAAVCMHDVAEANQYGATSKMQGFYLRKAQKTHGAKRQIEYNGDLAGKHVIVLEDVVTSGGSSLAAVQILRNAGAVVDEIICVVDREEGGAELFRLNGVKLTALLTGKELLAALEAKSSK